MPFQIIRNDITKVAADAIVNTANPEPVYADGTDRAIYQAAGTQELLAERKKIGPIRPGEVAVTPAFRLQAKYIIHAVGPVWVDGAHGEFVRLASCYRKSLLIARQLGCRSIAFPLISTGVYGFPKDRALDIALGQISEFLRDTDPAEDEMEVTLVVFDRKAFDLSAELVSGVAQYIDENYAEAIRRAEYSADRVEEAPGYMDRRRRGFFRRKDAAFEEQADMDTIFQMPCSNAPFTGAEIPAPSSSVSSASAHPGKRTEPAAMQKRSLEDLMSRVGETFQQCLLRMIDERGLTDAQVYKRANIDRKLFSKIRCNPDYSPHRRTAIALAVALELNMDEMTDLLRKAGMALSPGSRFDLIISYCVQNRIYDTMTINALLFDYDQPLLGA